MNRQDRHVQQIRNRQRDEQFNRLLRAPEGAWPTARELAKSYAHSAHRNFAGQRTSLAIANFALDLAVALGREGQDVRWLYRYCRGVQHRYLRA